jgi:hypothetical protein
MSCFLRGVQAHVLQEKQQKLFAKLTLISLKNKSR